MVQIRDGTLDARILKILLESYPITVEEVRKELGVSKRTMERAIKHLAIQGFIELEILPDKTFIRLLKQVNFIGKDVAQRKAFKKKGPKKEKKEYEGMMFG
jgi:DNA-binding transcriptional regulator GbsR (MarR family)